jgi:hypothetical protein
MTSDTRKSYMGFEIHPLIFLRANPPFQQQAKSERGFDAAVRICRPGESGDSAHSRVFQIERKVAFGDSGDARREASRYAESIIDGKEPGQSVQDL